MKERLHMIDPSTMCPWCLRLDAVSNRKCRFCKKSIPSDRPVGVLSPGVLLNGKYLTGLCIGQGGFGITYRAYDLVNKRKVAIKEYYPAGINPWCTRADGSNRIEILVASEFQYGQKHFRGEADTLKLLSDVEEVVRYYETFDENNTSYLVMELLEGQTLFEYLKNKTLSFYQAVDLLMPVLHGLKKVHGLNVLHRDIKPSNIYVCQDGKIKILDFGAAKAEGSPYNDSFMPAKSDGYSPPEQCVYSRDQGPWSDVYAVAGVIYRCVTGKRPPTASERSASEQLRFKKEDFTPSQQRVLEKNMDMKPENRCQDMYSFTQELLTCLSKEEETQIRTHYSDLVQSISSGRTAPPQPNGKKWKMARKVAAYCLDMVLFQGIPLFIAWYAGADLPMSLMLGYVLGTLIVWRTTCSDRKGSIGEHVFGLQVMKTNGDRPDSRESLLYCMLRMLWPLLPLDCICYAVSRERIAQKLSGCHSNLIDEKPEKLLENQFVLTITEGLYAGNSVSISSGRYVFGRYSDVCNFVYPITYNVVSRVQCILVIDAADNIFITNQSSYGTTVDGKKLVGEESVRAKIGSVISFGREKMTITRNEHS